MRKRLAAALWLALAFTQVAPRALADTQGSTEAQTPTSDLYLRRRPPGAPVRVPKDLEPLIRDREAKAAERRAEAIRLLEILLKESPRGVAAGEAIFKLAELSWEEAKRKYVSDMGRYERQLEACRRRDPSCVGPPTQPRLNLDKSTALYQRLVAEHPDYRRIDLAKYLIGFSARERGDKDALTWFERVIAEHPDSPLVADSWMMIGEHHFGTTLDFKLAREAYLHVLDHPEASVYDLALFKTAWCDWKLGDTASAALRFKKVLDLAAEAERSGSNELRRRRAQLRDEAIEYLIVLLSDDESVTAKDAYDFLASIGGERYSREVLSKLAERFGAQTRYDRAIPAYQFLLSLDADHPDAPKYQIAIVDAYMSLDQADKALDAAKTLADEFGPKSGWAKANQDRKALLVKTLAAAEEALRTLGKRMHEDAQRYEKDTRKIDPARYGRAAEVYAFYLERFGASASAGEMRFFRAEILFFKLGKLEEAGDEYLAVGKSKPVGKLHKDALLKAMAAYEKARPKANGPQKRELVASDRKFAEATDLYATLFPADPEIVTVIFRNGQMFLDHGDYDEAVKRFGLIVTKYPNDPNAGAAGDRILDALVKGEDYENVETWSRKLKGAKAFQAKEDQNRLDRLIVESVGKSAESYAAKGEYEKAAGFYQRVADEFPKDPLAATSLFNAAVVLEKGKQPEKAGETYLQVAKRYPKSKEAPKSAWTAGQVFEQMAYFDRAAAAYGTMAQAYPDGEHAPDALFNAGVLEQAQGKHREAIQRYQTYAKRFKDRPDAEAVAFRVGVVYENVKEHAQAAQAFKSYVDRYRKGPHVVEAWTRTARAQLALGKEKAAESATTDALRAYKGLGRAEQKTSAKFAAEARYLQGELVFRDYQKIGLDVKPAQLKRTLDKKSGLLADAQKAYIEVVEYQDPAWATAALFRIGQMYEQFATELRSAPVPPELSEEEQTVYREELDKYVINIEDKAIGAFETGYQKAIELHVYNADTRRLREGLGRLAASKFPPENEVRVKTRLGDRPPKAPLVKDVVRE